MAEDDPILNRLLTAIADSEADHPGNDRYIVDLTRKDAIDAVKRIADLIVRLSEVTTEFLMPAPTIQCLPTSPKQIVKRGRGL